MCVETVTLRDELAEIVARARAVRECFCACLRGECEPDECEECAEAREWGVPVDETAILCADLRQLARRMRDDSVPLVRCTGCDVMTRADLMEDANTVVFWGHSLCPACFEDAHEHREERESEPVVLAFVGGR